MSERIPTFDVAKGAAILLVVFGHCLRGLTSAGIATSEVWTSIDRILYLFHMPVFFVLGGMLCSVDKLANPRAMWQRVWMLMLPYFLWTAIQGTFEIAFSSLKNKPAGLETVLGGFLHPRGQFWFLPAFLFATIFTVACSRLPSWKLWLMVPAVLLDLVPGLGRTGLYASAFCFGAILGRDGMALLVRPWWTWSSIVLFAVAGAIDLHHPKISVYKHAFLDGLNLMWIGIVGSAGFIGLCSLPKRALSDALVFLGRHSMPIFLAHILFMSGGRIVLAKFLGLSSLPLHVGVGMALGVIGPILMYRGAQRARITFLFGG